MTHYDVALPGTELYYQVRPYASGIPEPGAPTYTIGVWTGDYGQGISTMGLPLRPYESYDYIAYYHISYYCDNIPYCVGISYMEDGVWKFHAKQMPPGVYDPEMTMIMGVQVAVSQDSYFSHVGV
jgi:hypothetical protein